MKISKIELIEIKMPLVHFFETSFGRTYERRIILARVETADGAEGWGECTAGETPSYCEEWTGSCWAVLKEILAPMILNREIESAAEVWDVMKRFAATGWRKRRLKPPFGIWKRKIKRAALETSWRRKSGN
jgi:O-succinylbenzoate synthase